jgi:cobalamin biosynthesis protein CobW
MTNSSAKVPATIITGFLGAGKTTLIRNLLEKADGRRLALIINEFGDVGVDGDILRSCGIENCPDENIVELANGCICCTVADDFLPTLNALLALETRPDHIVIETSGLALPKPLVQAFQWPDVRSQVTVDGVIAVIDGPAVADGRFVDDPEAVTRQRIEDPSLDHENPLEEVYEDQLLCADMIVVNKSDLLDVPTQQSVAQEVTATVPRAVKLVMTNQGRVDPAVLLGLGAAAEDDLASRPSHHDGEDDHDHDDFESFVVDVPIADSPEAITNKLRTISEEHDVLRVKGFVAIDGKPMRLLVQGVGARFQHHYDRVWSDDDDRMGRIVVIGRKGLDEDAIRQGIAG